MRELEFVPLDLDRESDVPPMQCCMLDVLARKVSNSSRTMTMGIPSMRAVWRASSMKESVVVKCKALTPVRREIHGRCLL